MSEDNNIIKNLENLLKYYMSENEKLRKSSEFIDNAWEAEIGLAERQSYDEGYLDAAKDILKCVDEAEKGYGTYMSCKFIRDGIEKLTQGVGDS